MENQVEDMARLEEQLAELTAKRDARDEEVKQLRASEDPSSGRYYAQEIFEAQQDKLKLEVEVQVCTNKIRLMRMNGAQPSQ
ncbi:MAG: hypothetical protein D6E12_08275 [Desulfovibrio sp.]|nr:MAG: hypothetical protein D6E12_08275 [Desulfovibrio sp.]